MLQFPLFQRLNAGAPINRAHPINRGLKAAWTVKAGGHPSFCGGPKLKNLSGTNHGTLTNGATWAGAMGRPGGHGSISFDGTDDYVLTANTALGLNGAYSVGAWYMKGTGYPASFKEFIGWNNKSGIRVHGTTGDIELLQFNGSAIATWSAAGPTTTGVWARIIMAVTGQTGTDTATLYVDGKSAGDVAIAPGSPDSATSINMNQLKIGDLLVTNTPFLGSIDGVSLWSRYITAGEAGAEFRYQKQQRNPLLNWIESPVASAPAAASEYPFWAIATTKRQQRRRRQLAAA